MVAIGGGSQSHNLHDEEARMRKLVSVETQIEKRATFADVVGDVR